MCEFRYIIVSSIYNNSISIIIFLDFLIIKIIEE